MNSSREYCRPWSSRRYLPHNDQPGLVQSVTFRLFDALPANIVAQWIEALAGDPADNARAQELRERIEQYEDTGHGACWLARPDIAQAVEQALLHFDGERYRILAWCVMPNHVHVVTETTADYSHGSIVATWKSFSAKQANRILGRNGMFWMPDYYDRTIRDDRHFATMIAYVESNPVKAGLIDKAELWPFSSARLRYSTQSDE
jgi:REP element-mobilizing transposase RayT